VHGRSDVSFLCSGRLMNDPMTNKPLPPRRRIRVAPAPLHEVRRLTAVENSVIFNHKLLGVNICIEDKNMALVEVIYGEEGVEQILIYAHPIDQTNRQWKVGLYKHAARVLIDYLGRRRKIKSATVVNLKDGEPDAQKPPEVVPLPLSPRIEGASLVGLDIDLVDYDGNVHFMFCVRPHNPASIEREIRFPFSVSLDLWRTFWRQPAHLTYDTRSWAVWTEAALSPDYNFHIIVRDDLARALGEHCARLAPEAVLTSFSFRSGSG
jgi:hypothetical protein